jgi:hypothetical protein
MRKRVMRTYRYTFKQSLAIALLLAFGIAIVLPSVMPDGVVKAAQLASRKVDLDSVSPGNVTTDVNGNNGTAGGYYNGAQTTHVFTFNLGTTAATKGIAIQYCTTPLPQTTCTAPTGLVTSGQSGTYTTTGFTTSNSYAVDNTFVANAGYFATGQCAGTTPFRQNCVLLTNAAGASTNSGTTITISLGDVTHGWLTNPTAVGTYYVRIATFTDTGFTTLTDQGTVAFTINNNIEINSAVQESLAFSVGTTNTAPTAACLPQGGGGIVGLGTLSGGIYALSTIAPSTANSYWRLSTNAANGTDVDYNGDTLKSGANAIATNAAAQTISNGQEFFGMTIDSSNGAYSFTNLTRQGAYTGNTTYALNAASFSPTLIAQASAGTTVACDTGAMKYIGSVSPTTKPGIYKTSINYFAIPKF